MVNCSLTRWQQRYVNITFLDGENVLKGPQWHAAWVRQQAEAAASSSKQLQAGDASRHGSHAVLPGWSWLPVKCGPRGLLASASGASSSASSATRAGGCFAAGRSWRWTVGSDHMARARAPVRAGGTSSGFDSPSKFEPRG